LRKVVELVHAEMEGDLSLEELADAAGLSIAHFSEMFRQSTGQSSDSATNKRWREDWAGLMPLWTASDQEVDLRGDSRNSSREKKGRRRHAKKAPPEDHAAGPRTSKNAR
jgi:hypothetical protein